MDRPRQKIERILVVHTAFLGDLILTAPFFEGLRKIFPHAEILFVTNKVGTALFDPNPWNLKFELFDKRGADSGPLGLWRKIKKLRAFRPQLTFCLHRSYRSALLARGAGAPVWGFFEGSASFLFEHRVHREGHSFEAQKNLALLHAYLSGQGEALELSVFPKVEYTQKHAEKAQAMLKGRGGFVALVPSSVWATKRWPAEKFGELAILFAKKKSMSSVLVGGHDGMDAAIAKQVEDYFLKHCSPDIRGLAPLNLAGKTDLGVLKAVLAKAKLVVSNDSAPLHMAIAVGAPVHGIYGPTTREIGFFPLAPEGKSGVSEIVGLECRPCGLHGHKACPLGHFRCMLELSAQTVFAEAVTLCP